ncbi:MAG TPA: helix-turn-helix transcriptional regulator [Burkholderiaceae bacterium]|nr:helix-turn-helix transcriptional regulator [Burkholderiaceae bacterium]
MSTALIGQMLGGCLLLAGQEEDGDDLLRSQVRHYQDLSRAHVRWLGAMDQGYLSLHMNRPARAADAFCAVADDPMAEPGLRIEAMALAALALHSSGECRTGWKSLQAARHLASQEADETTRMLVEAAGLEMASLQRMRCVEGLADHTMFSSFSDGVEDLPSAKDLERQLMQAAGFFEIEAPVVAYRLSYLAQMVSPDVMPSAAVNRAADALAWARAHRLRGIEAEIRVEAGLLLLAKGSLLGMSELIGPLGADDKQLRRCRHAIDLHYCLSRLCYQEGRVGDAFRWYRSHSQEAVSALRANSVRRLTDSYMDAADPTPGAADGDDVSRARLPLRYRKAYQYILENLHDENLSVQSVANYLGVTERALQMAFRTHLGMTPAELIRTRRAEGVRSDLCAYAGDQQLDEIAQRWGLRNRSTLSNIYRNRFAETPAQTLRGRRIAA